MHYGPMFGFHDYTTDPRSGRPQPHYLWVVETVTTLTAWVLAASFLVGGLAFYVKSQELDGPMQMALGSILLAAIAYWRQTMLVRKRAALREAVKTYEAMLADPFG